VNTVELNSTFRRLPAEDQFERWAEQTEPGFKFAVTLARRVTSFGRVEGVDAAAKTISRLGDRLGPVRIKVLQARDDGFLRLLLDSLEPTMRWALDFRHDSWLDDEIQARLDERGVARVDAEEGSADFRYLRLRNPPYSDDDLATEAVRIDSIIAAGLDVFARVFDLCDPEARLTAFKRDGERFEPGDVVLEVEGDARALLLAERTALNFVQRLSGVATATARLVERCAGRARILDTRKTTPLLRALEKYAVRAGGAQNHRAGLDDGILIKDNHIRLAGNVGRAVTRMRKANREMPTEVEAQTLDQVNEALEAGADIVLLDNMSTSDIREAVNRCRGRAKTEISGGVTLPRMAELAATGADFVSIGALTHSAPAADLSFEIEPVGTL